MTTATLAEPLAASGSPRRGELALLMQEAFTAALRLRTNRQAAASSAAFRNHVKQLLATADQEARQAGYQPEQVRLAVYAYTAFLDESVLNSGQPLFAEWPGQPLQEELFGDHIAGENFFRYLDGLMAQQDSEDLADLIEVFQLCLLLGFRGKYGRVSHGELQALLGQLDAKIRRVRGSTAGFSPSWALPQGETLPVSRDPWIRPLAVLAAASAVVALVSFVGYRLLLRSDLVELQALVSRLVG